MKYLGLDSSTQSLSALIIDSDTRKVIYECSLNFENDLSHYGTQNGTIKSEMAGEVHSLPLMWVDAMDLIFAKMRDEGAPLSELDAIAGSGQQHGSVYLNKQFPEALSTLSNSESLVSAIKPCLSRETSPIWMDSSTTVECDEIREALGGLEATSKATGSSTFERFTGPQIRKFYKTQPEAYEQTEHIALVSSFLASIVAGKISPIDPGDGAGMNLMDIEACDWHPGALSATAPDLGAKLPTIEPSWTVLGSVSEYFSTKYGVNPEANALVWSGDNPNSVVGLGLVEPGMVAISLGTSDTFFGTMAECSTDPKGEGHVFGSPAGGYMSLICFMNGSLAREQICDAYGLDWDGFSAAIQSTPVGNNGALMLPYFEPEIVPKVLNAGVRRKDLDEADVGANCRGVVEAQMMSMKTHSAWMGASASQIYVTGGASRNREILQIMADVFNCSVVSTEVANGAALGSALRAMHGAFSEQGDVQWNEITKGFTDPDSSGRIEPDPTAVAVYEKLLLAFQAFEDEHL